MTVDSEATTVPGGGGIKAASSVEGVSSVGEVCEPQESRVKEQMQASKKVSFIGVKIRYRGIFGREAFLFRKGERKHYF